MDESRKEHDKIVKLFLGDHDIAYKFLSLYLPPEILSKFNLAKIQVEPGT